MGFYKPGANHTVDPAVARLHNAIWTLIFGGLLLSVLGIFVHKTHDVIGWIMVAVGVIGTVVGGVLVYVRSRIQV